MALLSYCAHKQFTKSSIVVGEGKLLKDADWLIQNCEQATDEAIRHQLRTIWGEDKLEQAHNNIVAQYRAGERYYKKGRPFGAKNIKDDNDAIDALRELEDEEESMFATDEYDKKILATLEKKQEVKTSPLSEFNSQTVKELIAEQFEQFIKAYGRDKSDMLSGIERGLKEALTSFENDMNKRFDEMKPNIIELKHETLPTIKLGVQHKNFEKLLRMCSARHRNGSHNNVWIYGPAGTGKSTAAEYVARALNLDFYTDGKMADETKVLGYQDANGTYRTTNFRKAFENGGVYLADEIDGSMPDALLALNGALANGHCSFPDCIISRHKDFIFLAAANTTGTGGTIEYVGRFKQDAAFNDRFVFLDWPLDEALEDSLIANKEWLRIVKSVRAKILSSGIKGHLITPRASIYGETLLNAGLSLEDVKESVLKKGLTDAQWNSIKS